MQARVNDPVTRPAHYTFSSIEVFDAIEAWQLNFARGAVVKYLVRAGRKDQATEIEDLCKALYCLSREISRVRAGKSAEAQG